MTPPDDKGSGKKRPGVYRSEKYQEHHGGMKRHGDRNDERGKPRDDRSGRNRDTRGGGRPWKGGDRKPGGFRGGSSDRGPPRGGSSDRGPSQPARQPLDPKKLEAGIPEACTALESLMAQFNDASDQVRFTGMEIQVSFDSQGKFIGIGSGGVATIKLVIAPAETGAAAPKANPKTKSKKES